MASQVTAAVEASMFVLIGEGPLRADLARAIDAAGLGDRVELHGREPDARAVLGGLDIALQASLAEGLPMPSSKPPPRDCRLSRQPSGVQPKS